MGAALCALQTSWTRWQRQAQGPRNLGSRLTLLFDLSAEDCLCRWPGLACQIPFVSRRTAPLHCCRRLNPVGEFFYDGSTITPFEVMFVTMNSMIVENNWSFARQAFLYQNWMSAQVGGAMAEGAQTADVGRVLWPAEYCCCWGRLREGATPSRVLSCLPSGLLHASAALLAPQSLHPPSVWPLSLPPVQVAAGHATLPLPPAHFACTIALPVIQVGKSPYSQLPPVSQSTEALLLARPLPCKPLHLH